MNAIRLFKYLPFSLRSTISKLYKNYQNKMILDTDLVENLMEYFKLNRAETMRLLKTGSKQFHTQWREIKPTSDKEITSFYRNASSLQIFALAYWHMTRSYLNFRNDILKYCSGDILDYGGGIGDLSIWLVNKGYNVTYCDISSANIDFAVWLSNKRMCNNIKIIDLEKCSHLSAKYDTILCIDVIEHIPDQEYVLRRFAEHLRINGKLIITKLDYRGDSNPTHLMANIDGAKLLSDLGLKRIKDWLWIKYQ